MYMDEHNTTSTNESAETLKVTPFLNSYYFCWCTDLQEYSDHSEAIRLAGGLSEAGVLGVPVHQVELGNAGTKGTGNSIIHKAVALERILWASGDLCAVLEPIRRLHAWGDTFTRRLQGWGGLGDFFHSGSGL